ncbi:MAG: hypothetical protein V3U29_01305 [Phycisphaeraceae bacterium]
MANFVCPVSYVIRRSVDSLSLAGSAADSRRLRHRGAITACCLVGLLAAGCKSAAILPNADPNRSITRVTDRLAHHPPDHATSADWDADPRRLPDDVGRTIDQLYGARLSVRYYHAPGEGDGAPADAPAMVVRARALHPDGRTVWVVVHSTSPEHVRASVRVGNFGDPAVERTFIKKLRKVLKGKPKRQRGGTFELP